MSRLKRGLRSLRIAGRKWLGRGAIRLRSPGKPSGWALLSYLIDPFVSRVNRSGWHSNWWECRQIAQTFLDLGMGVDVVDWHDESFVPSKDYRILVDIGTNMPRLAPLMKSGCVKLMHATAKHWQFQNAAELKRLNDVAQRRGVALVPRRMAPAGCGLELCDLCTVLGDEATLATFRYANKPLFPIPLSPAAEFPWDETKDFARARRRFLWLGSGGLVLKGLDLVLEAFVGMPDVELVVCGAVSKEADFEQCYWRELYDTPNIRTVGWVDVTKPAFAALAREAAALIYPSASEGCAGSVVTCMHAGLIPLVSRESGAEVGDFGHVLAESNVPAIREAVRQLSRQSAEELRHRSQATWEFARRFYTRERFAEEFRRVVVQWLDGRQTVVSAAAA